MDPKVKKGLLITGAVLGGSALIYGAYVLFFKNSSPSVPQGGVVNVPPSTTRKGPLTIIEAKYGCDLSSCVKMDVTAQLQGFVENNALVIEPSENLQHYNIIFGRDPAPNLKKSLYVKYKVAGVEKFVQVADNKGLSLNV